MSQFTITIVPEGSLGLNIASSAEGTSVLAVAAGGLAEASGLRVNDLILRVNELSVVQQPHQQVLLAIKAAGRPVRLTISRSGGLQHAAAEAAREAGQKVGGLFKGFLGATLDIGTFALAQGVGVAAMVLDGTSRGLDVAAPLRAGAATASLGSPVAAPAAAPVTASDVAAARIQALARGVSVRNELAVKRACATFIASVARGWLARRSALERRCTVIFLQSIARGMLARKKLRALRTGAADAAAAEVHVPTTLGDAQGAPEVAVQKRAQDATVAEATRIAAEARAHMAEAESARIAAETAVREAAEAARFAAEAAAAESARIAAETAAREAAEAEAAEAVRLAAEAAAAESARIAAETAAREAAEAEAAEAARLAAEAAAAEAAEEAARVCASLERFRIETQAAICIQAFIRMLLTRIIFRSNVRVERFRISAIRIQSAIRGLLARRAYITSVCSIIVLQSVVRGMLVRVRARRDRRTRYTAVVCMQSLARSFIARARIPALRDAYRIRQAQIVTIQAQIRRWLQRNTVAERRSAVSLAAIQRAAAEEAARIAADEEAARASAAIAQMKRNEEIEAERRAALVEKKAREEAERRAVAEAVARETAEAEQVKKAASDLRRAKMEEMKRAEEERAKARQAAATAAATAATSAASVPSTAMPPPLASSRVTSTSKGSTTGPSTPAPATLAPSRTSDRDARVAALAAHRRKIAASRTAADVAPAVTTPASSAQVIMSATITDIARADAHASDGGLRTSSSAAGKSSLLGSSVLLGSSLALLRSSVSSMSRALAAPVISRTSAHVDSSAAAAAAALEASEYDVDAAAVPPLVKLGFMTRIAELERPLPAPAPMVEIVSTPPVGASAVVKAVERADSGDGGERSPSVSSSCSVEVKSSLPPSPPSSPETAARRPPSPPSPELLPASAPAPVPAVAATTVAVAAPPAVPRLPALSFEERIPALAAILKTRDFGRACVSGLADASLCLATLCFGQHPAEFSRPCGVLPSLADVKLPALTANVREAVRELLLQMLGAPHKMKGLPAGAVNLLVELLLADRCPPRELLFREMRCQANIARATASAPTTAGAAAAEEEDDEPGDEDGDTFDVDAPIGVALRAVSSGAPPSSAVRESFSTTTTVRRAAHPALLLPRPQSAGAASPWKHHNVLISLLEPRSAAAAYLDFAAAGAVCAKYGFFSGVVAAAAAEISSCTAALSQNASFFEIDEGALHSLVKAAATTAVHCDDAHALGRLFSAITPLLALDSYAENALRATLGACAAALIERDAEDAVAVQSGTAAAAAMTVHALTAAAVLNMSIKSFAAVPRTLIFSLPAAWVGDVDVATIFEMTTRAIAGK